MLLTFIGDRLSGGYIIGLDVDGMPTVKSGGEVGQLSAGSMFRWRQIMAGLRRLHHVKVVATRRVCPGFRV